MSIQPIQSSNPISPTHQSQPILYKVTIHISYYTHSSINSISPLTQQQYNLLTKPDIQFSDCSCNNCIFCTHEGIYKITAEPAPSHFLHPFNNEIINKILNKLSHCSYLVILRYKDLNTEYSSTISDEFDAQEFRNFKDNISYRPNEYSPVGLDVNIPGITMFITNKPEIFLNHIPSNLFVGSPEHDEYIRNTNNNIIGAFAIPRQNFTEHSFTSHSGKTKYVELTNNNSRKYKFIVPEDFEVNVCSKDFDESYPNMIEENSCSCPIFNFSRYHVREFVLDNYSGSLIDHGKLKNMLKGSSDKECKEMARMYFDDNSERYESFPGFWNVPMKFLFIGEGYVKKKRVTRTELVECDFECEDREVMENRHDVKIHEIMKDKDKFYLNEEEYEKLLDKEGLRIGFEMTDEISVCYGNLDGLNVMEDVVKG